MQIDIIPVKNEYHLEYAKEVKKALEKENFRVKLDDRDEKLSYKMREAQISKVPLTLVLGDKEKESRSVSFRCFGSKDVTCLSLEEFVLMVNEKINNKK